MNKFKERLSTFWVFVLLLSIFSGTVWALVYLDSDEEVVSGWFDHVYNTGDASGSTYDKADESYTLSIDTFGYIGTLESGFVSGVMDDETNKEAYYFDIDGDFNVDENGYSISGEKVEVDGNGNHISDVNGGYDYILYVDTWEVTVPLNVALAIAPYRSSIILLSPIVTLVNNGDINTNVFIREMVELDENGKAAYGEHGINFVSKDAISEANELYLGVTYQSTGNTNNAFDGLEEQSLDTIFYTGNQKPSADDYIELGTLAANIEELGSSIPKTSGSFLFCGDATPEFVTANKTTGSDDDGNKYDIPKTYKLSYKFTKADA